MMFSDTGWIINGFGTVDRIEDGVVTEQGISIATLRERRLFEIANRAASTQQDLEYRRMYHRIYGGLLR